MSLVPLSQHQEEIQSNRKVWRSKPLLSLIYADFYSRLLQHIDPGIPGLVVEIGSGMGNLKHHLPSAICTDLFPNDWLDVVCDGYELPFSEGSVSHLVLLDVFHHLAAPNAFLKEALRVLAPGGRIVLMDPYISLFSYPIFGLIHHEPVGMGQPINGAGELARPRHYHAAQGNATRLFFKDEWAGWPGGWQVRHREAFSSFSSLLSGGFSKPAVYPRSCFSALQKMDRSLSRWPRIFAGRCLVVLERT